MDLKPCTVYDIEKVERVLGHSTVFHSSADDGLDIKYRFEIAFWWLTTAGNIVFMPDDDTVICFQPKNFITYEMHIGVIEGASRKKTFAAAAQACEWLLTETGCQKLVSAIPAFHRASILYARLCGMKQEGISPKSFLKDGALHDCVLLGATKDELVKRYGGVPCHQ